MSALTATEGIYLHDSQCQAMDDSDAAVDKFGGVAGGAIAFRATGGGQPHDMDTHVSEGGSVTVSAKRGQGAEEEWVVADEGDVAQVRFGEEFGAQGGERRQGEGGAVAPPARRRRCRST